MVTFNPEQFALDERKFFKSSCEKWKLSKYKIREMKSVLLTSRLTWIIIFPVE